MMEQNDKQTEDQTEDQRCKCGACPACRWRRGPGVRAKREEWQDDDNLAMIRAAGKRVQWVRQQLDLKRPEFAAMCRVSLKSLMDIERGKPKDQVFLMIACRGMKIHYYRFFWPEEKWARFAEANLAKFAAQREFLAKHRQQFDKDDDL